MDNYSLDSEKIYFSEDYLTLDTDEGPKTLRIGEWLNTDPVRIHKMIIRDLSRLSGQRCQTVA